MPIISQELISACYHSSCASSHMGQIWLTTMWWSMHRARQWNFSRLKWSSETDSGCTYSWIHCILFSKIPKIKGWKQRELRIKEWEPISFNLTFIQTFNRITTIQRGCQPKPCWITVPRSLMQLIMTSRQTYKWIFVCLPQMFSEQSSYLIEV